MADEGRIISKDDSTWGNFSQVQKITWLWLETNRFIREFANRNQGKVYYLNSKDLFTNVKEIQSMLSFLGVSGISEEQLSSQIAVRVNKQPKNKKTKLTNSDRIEIQELVQKLS